MAGYADKLLGGAADAGAEQAGRITVNLVPAPPSTPYTDKLFSQSSKAGADEPQIANADVWPTHKSTADFTTLSKAAMVEDPQTKLKIFAQARFPKDSKAIDRYGILNGKVVYVGDDDQLHSEEPPGFFGGAKQFAASAVGNLPTLAGGMYGGAQGAAAGSVLGPPGMILGGAAGAALGAAGGKGIEKVAANLAFNEPQTAVGNAKAMGTEAAFSAGGTVVGLGLAKWLEKGRLARDFSKLDPNAVADLQRKAANVGGTGARIDLNPAQLSNVPSVKGKYDVLASMPTSRDIIAEGAKREAEQAYTAADRFIKSVSPRDGLDEAGEVARDGARKVIGMVTQERAAAARPLYQSAFERFEQKGGIPAELLPRAQDLMGRPSMQRAGAMAVRIAKDEGIDLADPKKSLLGMHYMKLALDKMTKSEAQTGLERTSQGVLIGLKKELLGIMDNLSPEYAEARKVFAHFSPSVDAIKQGVVSRVAGLSDDSINKAADMVFKGNISPNSVGKTRELFARAGLQDDWNTLLASYLRSTFEEAGRGYMTTGGAVTQAPKWAVQLTNPRQRLVLQQAMSPAQYQALTDINEVFSAMGRTAGAGAGSQTMPRMEAAKVLRDEAGTGVVGAAAQVLQPHAWGQNLRNWLNEARVGKHAEKLAEIMTTPGGISRLKDLRRLSPGSIEFTAKVSALFGISLAPPSGGNERPTPP